MRFACDAKFLSSVELVNLITRFGPLDVSFKPAGFTGYEELFTNAIIYEVDGVSVTVASLDDVIRSKRAANRSKDRAALPELEALREEIRRRRLARPTRSGSRNSPDEPTRSSDSRGTRRSRSPAPRRRPGCQGAKVPRVPGCQGCQGAKGAKVPRVPRVPRVPGGDRMSRALSSATRSSPQADELVGVIVTEPLGRLLE